MKLTLFSKLGGLVRKAATRVAHSNTTSICPEYDTLVQSFDKWEREVRRSNLVVSAPPLLRGIDLHDFAEKNHFPPVPEIVQRLSALPAVKVCKLKAEDSTCSICLERFKDTFETRFSIPLGETYEKPIQLPCGHIFGDICFQKWQYPFGKQFSCPVCRAENFSRHAATPTVQDMHPLRNGELWLDEEIWTDFVCGKRRSQEQRALYRHFRYAIASARIDMANHEWSWFSPRNRKEMEAWRQRRFHIDDMYSLLRAAEWDHDRDIALSTRLEDVDWDSNIDGEYIVHDYIGEISIDDTAWRVED